MNDAITAIHINCDTFKRLKQNIFCLSLLLLACNSNTYAQEWTDNHDSSKRNLAHGIETKLEWQSTFSKGKTPLWLNANKYGLSSLEKNNGYFRATMERPLQTDSARRWGIGYGIDIAAAYNNTSHFIVQQAFAEVRWLHGKLTVGSKQQLPVMKNAALSSGAQTLGINARPVPQVRLELPEYWAIPVANRWIQLKGHISYGILTDDSWQKDFTTQKSKYAEHTLFHSKAGYLRIGKDEELYPVSLEFGLEMATLFGGTTYMPDGNGQMERLSNGHGLKSFWHALIPGGSDITDGAYANVEGDELGSWLLRLNYNTDNWRIGLYADKFFEDHSGMFLLDYDGYGEGEEHAVKKHTKFFLYDMKDIMLGAELNLKYTKWIKNIVAEYIYTKYQSGPVYHDHTFTISEHIAGIDNYYNHAVCSGWQHWGQVMGNPLYRSPLYNEDGRIEVEDNRFVAWHLGFDGAPTDNLAYRVLATWQEGVGSYDRPYLMPRRNVSLLAEISYQLRKGWTLKCGFGADFGKILGNNRGLQISASKQL